MMMFTFRPARSRAMESDGTMSPSPPVLAKGVASDDTIVMVENVARNGVAGEVTCLAGDLAAPPLAERFDIIVANVLASVLATAGDVVFSGDPEGYFFALDARTGKRLWSFQTGAGHRGSSITYSVNGRQYVATPTGWGSIVGGAHQAFWPDRPAPRDGSALVVFALPREERQ